jgi:hypothetical protein
MEGGKDGTEEGGGGEGRDLDLSHRQLSRQEAGNPNEWDPTRRQCHLNTLRLLGSDRKWALGWDLNLGLWKSAPLGLGANGSIGVGAAPTEADRWDPPTPLGHESSGAGAAEAMGSGSGSGGHPATAGEPARGADGASTGSTSGGKTLRDSHSGTASTGSWPPTTLAQAGAEEDGDGGHRASTGRDAPQLSTLPPGAKAFLLPRLLREATGLSSAEQMKSPTVTAEGRRAGDMEEDGDGDGLSSSEESSARAQNLEPRGRGAHCSGQGGGGARGGATQVAIAIASELRILSYSARLHPRSGLPWCICILENYFSMKGVVSAAWSFFYEI